MHELVPLLLSSDHCMFEWIQKIFRCLFLSSTCLLQKYLRTCLHGWWYIRCSCYFIECRKYKCFYYNNLWTLYTCTFATFCVNVFNTVINDVSYVSWNCVGGSYVPSWIFVLLLNGLLVFHTHASRREVTASVKVCILLGFLFHNKIYSWKAAEQKPQNYWLGG